MLIRFGPTHYVEQALVAALFELLHTVVLGIRHVDVVTRWVDSNTRRMRKLAITGAGDASKEQVAGMLVRMFNLKEIPKNLDATDGLAAAVFHFYQQDVEQKKSGTKSWEDYIRKNPGKVK